MRYEPDQRHAEIICQELGLGKASKSVATPGIKEILGEEKELGTEEARDSGHLRHGQITWPRIE